MSSRLNTKRALINAERPLYSKWLASELVSLVPWFKTQYINSRHALLDDYNHGMLVELEPHLDKALRYLDIPFEKVWMGNNLLEYRLGHYKIS